MTKAKTAFESTAAAGYPTDMALHPLSEIRKWDDALAVLGIQDSDQTPADAIRELNREIERLRGNPKRAVLDPADAAYYEGYEQARSDSAQAWCEERGKLHQKIAESDDINDQLRQRIGLGEAENERLERVIKKLQADLLACEMTANRIAREHKA